MHSQVSRLLRQVVTAPTATLKRSILADRPNVLEDFGRFLFAHINVHLAEGSVAAARTLLQTASALRPVYHCTNYEYFFLKARARVLHAERNTSAAARVFGQLLRLLEAEKEPPLVEARSEIAMELGLLHDEMGNKLKARQHFQRALQEAVATGCIFNQGAALFNLAAISLDLGEQETFERYCSQVIALSREHALTPHLARSLLLMANHWDFRDTPRLARSFYLEALTVYWKLPDMVKVSEILTRAGELASALGETSEYVLALHEALQLSRKLDFLQGLTTWTFWAAQVCKEAGLRERGLSVFEACSSMASSLSLEREKMGGALRAWQCLENSNQNLWSWLEHQAPPVGTMRAEGIDATGLPLVQYFWTEGVESTSSSYRTLGDDGGRLEPYSQSRKPRPWLVNRQRLVYLLSQLSHLDTTFFNAAQRTELSREAREIDGHQRKTRT
ncbi:MAG TPA: hypothetical protein VGO93_27590 [Candidatus Xenobia bacterium]|jgi:tetratricopeptide (TPR) repeat protein